MRSSTKAEQGTGIGILGLCFLLSRNNCARKTIVLLVTKSILKGLGNPKRLRCEI